MQIKSREEEPLSRMHINAIAVSCHERRRRAKYLGDMLQINFLLSRKIQNLAR